MTEQAPAPGRSRVEAAKEYILQRLLNEGTIRDGDRFGLMPGAVLWTALKELEEQGRIAFEREPGNYHWRLA